MRRGDEAMSEQREKATQCEAAEKAESKCSRCGNERIQSRHNYCVICGNPLKRNPLIIKYFPQKNRFNQLKYALLKL